MNSWKGIFDQFPVCWGVTWGCWRPAPRAQSVPSETDRDRRAQGTPWRRRAVPPGRTVPAPSPGSGPPERTGCARHAGSLTCTDKASTWLCACTGWLKTNLHTLTCLSTLADIFIWLMAMYFSDRRLLLFHYKVSKLDPKEWGGGNPQKVGEYNIVWYNTFKV